MIKLMENPEALKNWINKCKSDSEKNGAELRRAHGILGEELGKNILKDYPDNEFVVIIMMRAGLFFGTGMADSLDCTIITLDEKNDIEWNTPSKEYSNKFIERYSKQLIGKTVIIADAVINTGKTINEICNHLGQYSSDIIIATNVIQSEAQKLFENAKIYAVRISENKFEGGKVSKQREGRGPDTGDRLFKTMEDWQKIEETDSKARKMTIYEFEKQSCDSILNKTDCET
jgi:Phosphoribosylpyrophosphate synthetase